MLISGFSHADFFTIVDLPEGEHEYKFYVDGQWVTNPGEVCYISVLSVRHLEDKHNFEKMIGIQNHELSVLFKCFH